MRLLLKIFIIAAICFGAYNYYKTGEPFPEFFKFFDENPVSGNASEAPKSQERSDAYFYIAPEETAFVNQYIRNVSMNSRSMRAGTYSFQTPSGEKLEYTIQKTNPRYCPKVRGTIHDTNVQMSKPVQLKK